MADKSVMDGEEDPSFWDKHVVPFAGNTLGAIAGSWDSAKPLQEKALRTAGGLGELFAKPVSALAAYSPEAKAALLPIPKSLGGQEMIRAANNAINNGMDADYVFRKYGMAHDGKEWNRYVHDTIDEKQLKDAVYNGSGSGYLNDVISMADGDPQHLLNPLTKLSFDDMTPGMRGTFQSGTRYLDGRVLPGNVAVNKEMSLQAIREALRHEGQHGMDNQLARSYGTSPEMVANSLYGKESKALTRFKKENPGIKDAIHSTYEHNTGEVRARLNSRLGQIRDALEQPGGRTDPNHRFRGLMDVFRKGYSPRSFWE